VKLVTLQTGELYPGGPARSRPPRTYEIDAPWDLQLRSDGGAVLTDASGMQLHFDPNTILLFGA
jgi:hypothetical protein